MHLFGASSAGENGDVKAKTKTIKINKKKNEPSIEVEKLDLLATGAFSKVFNGLVKLDASKAEVPAKCAIKIVSLTTKPAPLRMWENRTLKKQSKLIPQACKPKDVRREVEIMELLQLGKTNLFILKLLSFQFYNFEAYLILELAVCNIFEVTSALWKKYMNPISTKQKCMDNIVVHLLAAVLDGILFMHDRGIIHKDIKPENILIDSEGVPKIADFGLSVNLETLGSAVPENKNGTLFFAPVEVVTGISIDKKTDAYSFGMTAITLFLNHLSPQCIYDLPMGKDLFSVFSSNNKEILDKVEASFSTRIEIVIKDYQDNRDVFNNLLPTLLDLIKIAPENRADLQVLLKNEDIECHRNDWYRELSREESQETLVSKAFETARMDITGQLRKFQNFEEYARISKRLPKLSAVNL